MPKAIVTLEWRKKPNCRDYKQRLLDFLVENKINQVTFENSKIFIEVGRSERFRLYEIIKKSRFAMLLRHKYVRVGNKWLNR